MSYQPNVLTIGVLALILTWSSVAAGASPARCAGSPLAIEDNIGESIQHGARTTRSVVSIAQIHSKAGGKTVGWLYVDDMGLVSVILKPDDSSSTLDAFTGRASSTGPFLLMRGLPRGFKAVACKD